MSWMWKERWSFWMIFELFLCRECQHYLVLPFFVASCIVFLMLWSAEQCKRNERSYDIFSGPLWIASVCESPSELVYSPKKKQSSPSSRSRFSYTSYVVLFGFVCARETERQGEMMKRERGEWMPDCCIAFCLFLFVSEISLHDRNFSLRIEEEAEMLPVLDCLPIVDSFDAFLRRVIDLGYDLRASSRIFSSLFRCWRLFDSRLGRRSVSTPLSSSLLEYIPVPSPLFFFSPPLDCLIRFLSCYFFRLWMNISLLLFFLLCRWGVDFLCVCFPPFFSAFIILMIPLLAPFLVRLLMDRFVPVGVAFDIPGQLCTLDFVPELGELESNVASISLYYGYEEHPTLFDRVREVLEKASSWEAIRQGLVYFCDLLLESCTHASSSLTLSSIRSQSSSDVCFTPVLSR